MDPKIIIHIMNHMTKEERMRCTAAYYHGGAPWLRVIWSCIPRDRLDTLYAMAKMEVKDE